jgi:acyl carrier protein
MVTREAVEQVVVQTLNDFLGSDAPAEIRAKDKPITGLGLTSMDGLDFACELQKELGCLIPANLNPFINDEGHVERTVQQIVSLIYSLCQKTEAVSV